MILKKCIRFVFEFIQKKYIFVYILGNDQQIYHVIADFSGYSWGSSQVQSNAHLMIVPSRTPGHCNLLQQMRDILLKYHAYIELRILTRDPGTRPEPIRNIGSGQTVDPTQPNPKFCKNCYFSEYRSERNDFTIIKTNPMNYNHSNSITGCRDNCV